MKLKTKRLLAAALALSLTANISLAAFAVSYDLTEGSVTIEADDASETGIYSWQDEDNKSSETDIDITSKGEETSNTVTISGDVSGADIDITDANIIVEDDDSAAILIEAGSTVDDLTVSDTTITVNSGDAGILIEDGTKENDTVVDMTIEDVDITLNANGTAGIQVGDKNVESEDEGNVDVTLSFNGNNTISVGEGLLDSLADDGVSVNVEGIVVGGNASDYAGPSGTDLEDDSSVTITTGEEGSSLEISGVTTGIHVKDGTTLIIDGDGENNDIDDSLDITIKDVENVNSTVAGNGIISYGTTVITDYVNLLIDGITTNENYYGKNGVANTNGIGSKRSGSLTISNGANVTINNIDGSYSGKSLSDSGIYLDGDSGELVIDGATVTITNAKNGIVAEGPSGTGTPNITISGGAQVEIGKYNTEGESDISLSGIYMHGSSDDTVQTLTITGEGTNVLINNKGSSMSGIDIGHYGSSNNSLFYVTDGAVIQIGWEDLTDAIKGCGISLINTDVFVNTLAKINIFNVLKYGINNYGPNETVIEVDNAEIVIQNSHSSDFQIGADGATNTTVTLKNYAKLITDTVGLGGTTVAMIVDNSTLEADEGIDLGATQSAVLEIRNGSRVVTGAVYDWKMDEIYGVTGATASLIVSGGTLELIDIDENNYRSTGLTKKYSEMLDSIAYATAESNGDVNFILPTSGTLNGNEDLTNFRLSITQLVALQDKLWEDDMTAEEFFDTYGFIIECDEEGTPTTLIFETYGVDSSGNYLDYNEDGLTNLTGTEWYVVDLTKGYDDELWVWTPAVVLSYFTLNEGKTLSSAVDEDESDPNKATVGEELTDYHDVVVRGQSLNFGNFQTKANYETTDLGDTAYAIYKDEADKNGIVLYIHDAMDDGKAIDSLSKDDVIIIKDDDNNKFYLASSGEEVGTYYYALVDDEGKFILDDDGNFIWYDEDGVAYTAESDGVALIAVLDSGTSYVLEVDGKYYRVNSNGEYTAVVAGEAISIDSLWSVFDADTRVRSNAQATGEDYNFENVFGGKDGAETEIEPEPEEEEETETTDPEPIVPIDPLEEENGTPGTSDTPASSETPTETPEETPAETPVDPEVPAEVPETPASSTPKTGDDSNVAIYLVMAALSGAALIGLGVTGKKKNEEA